MKPIFRRDIKRWIAKTKSVHTLQAIRALINKRIKALVENTPEPIARLAREKKLEIVKELFESEGCPDVGGGAPCEEDINGHCYYCHRRMSE